MGVSPADAPDAPAYVELEFDRGVPVAVDGEKLSAKEIILKLNKLGGENGIGLLDIVENRLVGMEIAVFGSGDRILLVSRFDNLGKGASGSAVQNMNIIMGVDETTGLKLGGRI